MKKNTVVDDLPLDDTPDRSEKLASRQPFFKVMQSEKAVFWLLLGAITLFAGALRLYKLDTYPLLFNQDASVMGYDAWNIWLTGHDHHGQFLPVFFTTFYDYAPPVANYVVAPFVGLLGLSEWSTRLPIALCGIITVVLVALIGRHWFNYKVGLLAALLLAIDPWHLNYSRIAHPAGFLPLFVVLALYCFTRGMILLNTQKEQVKRWQICAWFAASGVSLALLTGTYSTLKVEAPLLIVACIIASLPFIWRKRSRLVSLSLIWWLLTYAVCITPLFVAQLLNWKNAQVRYQMMSIFNQKSWLLLFLEQYSKHYNPSNLFFDGFPGGLSVHPFAIGELFWLEGLLWIFALIGLWQARHVSRKVAFSVPILIALWFVAFPIASSLTTMDIPHEIRSYNFLPLPELLAGYGAIIAWEEFSRIRFKWLPPKALALTITGIAIIILALFTRAFLRGYFIPLPSSASQFPYNTGLQPVLTQVMPKVQSCDVVWIDDDNQPYIYYLFYTQYDPNKIQPIARQIDKTGSGFGVIGQVHFGSPVRLQAPVTSTCSGKPSHVYWITRTQHVGSVWKVQATYKTENGVTLWRGFELVGELPVTSTK
jgi:4-amino-4-deoxy-L-arabinose transferase-like glycosyltransferase